MNLADHPNEIVSTTDDDEAKAFLSELRVLEKLQYGGAPEELLSRQVIRMDILHHATHWITALHYVGFERPEENGFAVRCLPKSMFTLEQFKLQSEAENREQFPHGYSDTPTGTN